MADGAGADGAGADGAGADDAGAGVNDDEPPNPRRYFNAQLRPVYRRVTFPTEQPFAGTPAAVHRSEYTRTLTRTGRNAKMSSPATVPKRRAMKKPASNAPPPELPCDLLALVARHVAAHIYEPKTDVASLRLVGPTFKRAVDAEIRHVMHTVLSGVDGDSSPARRCGFTKNTLKSRKNITTYDFATFDALRRHVCVLCKGHFAGGVNTLGIFAHDECVRAASISTVYFDGGNGGGDRIAAASPRALELVRANPWFGSKLADEQLATMRRTGWNRYGGGYEYRQALALPCPMIEPQRTVVGFLEYAVAAQHPAYVAAEIKAALGAVLDAVVAPAELAAAAGRRRRVVEALAADGIDLADAASDSLRGLDECQWRDVELRGLSSVVYDLTCCIKYAKGEAEALTRRKTIQRALRKRKLLRRDDPTAYDAYVANGLPNGVASMDVLVLAIAARAGRTKDLEAALEARGVAVGRPVWSLREFKESGTTGGVAATADEVADGEAKRQADAARRSAAEAEYKVHARTIRACTAVGCANQHRSVDPALGEFGPICGSCERG